jgi:hypothetical protein
MIRPMFVTALAFLAPCNLVPSDEPPPTVASNPPGETCASSADCGAERVCVEGRCRAVATSIGGELLAASGRELFLKGDPAAAFESYREAISAFERRDLAVPPEVRCEAAEAAVLAGDHAVPRDQAARLVHECALESLPGSPARRKALEALARLRFDGLSVERLDRDAPADAYFTGRPARPSADAVKVTIEIPDGNEPGWDDVKSKLDSDLIRLAAVDCFMQAWEASHADAETAALEITFRSKLKDMGSYDVFEGEPGLAELPGDGFGPCVSRALASKMGESIRVRRTTSWTMPVRVSARLR